MNTLSNQFNFKRMLLPAAIATALSSAAFAGNPEKAVDNSFITVNGKVTSTTPDSFMLDYGEGKILVEMDDWDWYKEGAAILKGDRVTVRGLIDNDLYESKTIEASTVFVKGLNTYFYANPADEEDLTLTLIEPIEQGSRLEINGEITEINGNEFTVDLGNTEINVDTRALGYDPLDDKGFQRLDEGDTVWVSGRMDYDLFEEEEIVADRIVTVINDIGKSNSMR